MRLILQVSSSSLNNEIPKFIMKTVVPRYYSYVTLGGNCSFVSCNRMSGLTEEYVVTFCWNVFEWILSEFIFERFFSVESLWWHFEIKLSVMIIWWCLFILFAYTCIAWALHLYECTVYKELNSLYINVTRRFSALAPTHNFHILKPHCYRMFIHIKLISRKQLSLRHEVTTINKFVFISYFLWGYTKQFWLMRLLYERVI